MAAPSYSSDLTDIVAPAFTTTNWSAFGGGASGLNAETDYYIIDSTCLSKNAWASDDKGMVFDNTTTITIPTGDAIFIWVTHLTPNSLAAEASGGIALCCGNGSTEGNLDRWDLGGSDTIVYDDRWICGVVDVNNVTPDTSGTDSPPYDFFGASANLPSGGPTKGAPFAIGAIRYGRAFTCTDGDLGNGYATFDGAATYNDNSTRRYGQIQFSKGVYTMQGLFEMGSSSTAVDFRDSNRVIFVANTKKVQSDFNGFEVEHPDSNVEWTNITVQALGTTSPGYFTVRHPKATVNLTNCTFVDFGDSQLSPNTTLDGVTFRNCGLVYQNGATITDCTFDQTTLVVDRPDLVTGCSFSSDGTAGAYGIRNMAPGVWTFDSNTFSGFGASGGNTAAVEVAHGAKSQWNVVGTGTVPTTNDVSGAGASLVVSHSDDSPAATEFDITLDVLDGTHYLVAAITDNAFPDECSGGGVTWNLRGTGTFAFGSVAVFDGLATADDLGATITITHDDASPDWVAVHVVALSGGTRRDTEFNSAVSTPTGTLQELAAFSPSPTTGDLSAALWTTNALDGDIRAERASDTGGDDDWVVADRTSIDFTADDLTTILALDRVDATDGTPGALHTEGVNKAMFGSAMLVASATGSHSSVATKTLTVKCVDSSGANIQNARVVLRAAAGGDLPANESILMSISGTTVTAHHTTAHGLTTGDTVIINGPPLHPEYQGSKTVASTPTTTTWTFTVSSAPDYERENYFEGTDAVTITTANSDDNGGDAFATVSGSPEYDTAQSMHGSSSMLCVSGTTSRYVELERSVRLWAAARLYVRFASVAPSPSYIDLLQLWAGGTNVAGVRLLSTGRLVAVNGSTVISATDIAAHAVTTNTWYRVEMALKNVTDEYLSYAVYEGDSVTPLFEWSDDTISLSGAGIDAIYAGRISPVTQNSNGDWWIDCLGLIGTSEFIGPFQQPVVTDEILNGLTDSNGEVTTSSFQYTSDQPVSGVARKGSASPYYKEAPISGTITSAGFDTTVTMVSDE